MKKRVLSILLAVLMLLTLLPVTALAADDGDFTVVENVLTNYTGPGGEITIPDTVLEIAADVFKGNTAITGVTIPPIHSVTVNTGAIEGCTNLKRVSSEHYSDVRANAFKGVGTAENPAIFDVLEDYRYSRPGIFEFSGGYFKSSNEYLPLPTELTMEFSNAAETIYPGSSRHFTLRFKDYGSSFTNLGSEQVIWTINDNDEGRIHLLEDTTYIGVGVKADSDATPGNYKVRAELLGYPDVYVEHTFTVTAKSTNVSLTGAVTLPATGTTDATEITDVSKTFETITAVWSPALVENKFASNTDYTLTVTATPKESAKSMNLNITCGRLVNAKDLVFEKQLNGSYVATKTFDKTGDTPAQKFDIKVEVDGGNKTPL